MTLRELLQIELWSKDTSRKILTLVGKLLKRVAVVLGVLVVLFAICFVIERYWLTHWERTSGKVALTQVAELEKLVNCNCDRFPAVDGEAKMAVAAAGKQARTLRDLMVANELSFYLMEVEQEQKDDLQEAKSRLLMQQRHLRWHSDPALENEIRSSHHQIFDVLRSALHKELD